MDWEPPVPHGWGDEHRAFLQALMARGSITLAQAKPILAAILSNVPGEDGEPAPELRPESIELEDLEAFVALGREAIMSLDYDIKRLRHQNTGEAVWAFVNVQSDPTTQLATAYSPDQIAFVKRLLDAIFDTYNRPRLELMCVTEDQALKLSRPVRGRDSLFNDNYNNNNDGVPQSQTEKPLKHSEVLDLMASLVAEGWLEKSAQGFYSLTPRALMELWTWMLESYNDPDVPPGEWQRIKSCEACKDVVTSGQRCADRNCNVRLHDMCEDAFWRSRRSRDCPRCRTPWEPGHYVGERAVTESEAYKRSHRRGAGRGDAVRSLIEEAEAEEERDGVDAGSAGGGGGNDDDEEDEG